ncbi:MAG: M3 family peptidase, partial [Sphingomonas sp.]
RTSIAAGSGSCPRNARKLSAADGFGRFAEAGLVDRATGDGFRDEVLARGATRPAAESFRAFRGRDPDPAAMLVRHGLTE